MRKGTCAHHFLTFIIKTDEAIAESEGQTSEYKF